MLGIGENTGSPRCPLGARHTPVQVCSSTWKKEATVVMLTGVVPYSPTTGHTPSKVCSTGGGETVELQ